MINNFTNKKFEIVNMALQVHKYKYAKLEFWDGNGCSL